VVSETPKNDASTRSHCIFVIQIESQKLGSDVKRVGKLHLVDLSGSERVHKSNVDDAKIIMESKYINSSLFQLQMVIMNLNKKAKGEDVHIPFRNSMMTMILRDSLGGNCRTKMIATISAL
jgi:kinesin family protein 6/9